MRSEYVYMGDGGGGSRGELKGLSFNQPWPCFQYHKAEKFIRYKIGSNNWLDPIWQSCIYSKYKISNLEPNKWTAPIQPNALPTPSRPPSSEHIRSFTSALSRALFNPHHNRCRKKPWQPHFSLRKAEVDYPDWWWLCGLDTSSPQRMFFPLCLCSLSHKLLQRRWGPLWGPVRGLHREKCSWLECLLRVIETLRWNNIVAKETLPLGPGCLVRGSALSLAHANLNKWLNLSVPQFPHLYIRDTKMPIRELLWGLSELNTDKAPYIALSTLQKLYFCHCLKKKKPCIVYCCN